MLALHACCLVHTCASQGLKGIAHTLYLMYWSQRAKVAGYGEIQVNTSLVEQMRADVKRWVPKPITAQNKEDQNWRSQRLVEVLCVPVVASDFL